MGQVAAHKLHCVSFKGKSGHIRRRDTHVRDGMNGLHKLVHLLIWQSNHIMRLLNLGRLALLSDGSWLGLLDRGGLWLGPWLDQVLKSAKLI